MSQTTYNLAPAIGVVGMPETPLPADGVVSYPAGEVINPGRLCEVSAGLLRQCQSTGATVGAKIVGVSMWLNYREQPLPAGAVTWVVGDLVPCVRKGRVFAAWNGTTQVELAVPQVNHQSVTATNRGVFTDAASSAVADSEIAPAPSPGVNLIRDTASTTMCLVELNLS